MTIPVPTHKQGWAVVNLQDGEVKTCADTFNRDEIIARMVQRGVPLTEIHAFEFTKHMRPTMDRVALGSPLVFWL